MFSIAINLLMGITNALAYYKTHDAFFSFICGMNAAGVLVATIMWWREQ